MKICLGFRDVASVKNINESLLDSTEPARTRLDFTRPLEMHDYVPWPCSTTRIIAIHRIGESEERPSMHHTTPGSPASSLLWHHIVWRIAFVGKIQNLQRVLRLKPLLYHIL